MAVAKEVTMTMAKRRAQRDTKRAEFFSDHGLKRCTDPFSIGMGPDQALSNIHKCLEIAQSLHEGDTGAILMTLAEVTSLTPGFGFGTAVPTDRPTMTDMDPDKLFGEYFRTSCW